MNKPNGKKIPWIVNTRDSWDSLYQRSVPVYWYKYESGSKPVSLYDMYHEMGVTNVEKCGDTDVIFRSIDAQRRIIKVSAFVSSNPVYTPERWVGLQARLTIKIPNRVLLAAEIVNWFKAINNNNLNDLLYETLANSYPPLAPLEQIKTVGNFIDGAKRPYLEDQYTVEIPKILVLLGVIDKFILNRQATNEFKKAFNRIEGQISNSLTVLLSQWTSLGRFFPFGFVMSEQDGWIRPPYCFPYWYQDATLQDSADLNEVAQSINNLAMTLQSKPNAESHNAAVNSGDRDNNRGGAQGLDNDYDWEHFAPEMVACNWQFLRALKGGIKHATSLSDYQAMLNVLKYTIPKFTEIFIELEDALPWGVTPDSTESAWNYDAYTTHLLVEYPKPPAPMNRPMAMCDLIADRVNEPFTSF